MGDYSKDPTVVEYAVQDMFKGKSLKTAARSTAKKFNGSTNMFIGSMDQISIDPDSLEDALWERLVGYTTASIPKIKPGKEHFALDGTIQFYRQKPTMRAELKKRVVVALGGDPFTNDGDNS